MRTAGQRCDVLESSRQYRDEPFLCLMARAASLDGARMPCRPDREPAATMNVLQAHYSSGLRAPSTANLDLFLGTIAATIGESTLSVINDTTIGWCAEAEVPDNRPVERLGLDGVSLKRRPRGASADHVVWNDHGESVQGAAFSAIGEVDEQDLVDDSTGQLWSTMISEFFTAAAELRPRLVFATLGQNPDMSDGNPLFDASHGNLKTSAALADATLGAAQAALGAQQSGDLTLNLRGRYLITPGALERAAGNCCGMLICVIPVARRRRFSARTPGLILASAIQ